MRASCVALVGQAACTAALGFCTVGEGAFVGGALGGDALGGGGALRSAVCAGVDVDRGFERDVWTVTWDSGVVSGWGCTGAGSGDGDASGCVAGASGDGVLGAAGSSSDCVGCCAGADACPRTSF